MLNFLKQPNIPFDLHIHSTYSDGNATPKEIMYNAEKLGLKYVSLTDHNNVDIYAELEKHNNYGFTGQVITGCEINTVMNGYYVEMLAYDFDLQKFKKWKYIKKSVIVKNNKKLLKAVIQRVKYLGFKLSKKIIFKNDQGLYYSELYNDILKYEENKPLLEKLNVKTYRDFLRKQIMSPSGKLYVLVKNSTPTAKQVCDYVHKCGGKVVFAHPYYYGSENGTNLIKIALNYNIDGIECAHFSHTPQQINYIKEVAQKHNLIVTGGSDYHDRPRTLNNKKVKSVLGYLNNAKTNLNTNIFQKGGIDYLK